MKTTTTAWLAPVILTLLCAGCAGHRPPRTEAELLELRARQDAQVAELRPALRKQLMAHVKARYDQHPNEPLVLNALIISGGGDWGAFGAGFLKGWSQVQGPLAKPDFDVVTGVSTGALIAPFAFLGDDESIDTIEKLYRNPEKDWVKKRLPLYFLPSNQSFATVPGLERALRERMDMRMVRRIVEASKLGRFLIVNTSDVDDGGSRMWDVGSEAEHAMETGDVSRIHRILLASAGIPGAFPFREIDGSLYVDGGVTGNILYAGATRDENSLLALWAATYPNLPLPKVRYWVIFNNQLRPLPQVTAPTWVAVVSRSLEMGTRSATTTALRHLFAQAQISHLKRGATVEVRVAAVPDDFVPPKPGTFIKETMNALADLGEKMGADPSSWRTEPP